jgi:hypothetical protein
VGIVKERSSSMSTIAQWMKTTVLIELTIGGDAYTGTGFLVGRPVDDGVHIYLVTNKHVLGPQRIFGQTLSLHLNVVNGENTDIEPRKVAYTYGPHSFREHPRAFVDICAVNVTEVINGVNRLSYEFIGYQGMALPDRILAQDIGAGDDILSIGYPLGYSQGVNNLPIVRQGVIATSLLYDLSGGALSDTRALGPHPAFLVDGGVVHGSSGSPILLKPVAGRLVRGVYEIGNTDPVLLGILAKTKTATIPNNDEPTYAGMGLAFRSEAIQETIERFYD